jgi:phenylacetic acid degradation operon negative regulatory protein
MGPSAKSLILDLLSTLRRGSMPVRALVAAGRLFGIAENALRVALARLLAAGVVERDARGRYRLGPAAEAVDRQVRSWRELERRVAPWRGDWIGVHLTGLGAVRGREAHRRARALAFLGFRSLAPGLELRPDNLRAGVDGVRQQLVELGLSAEAPVFRLGALDPERDRTARALWDGEALARGYAESRHRLAESRARLSGASAEAAMAETFLLGGSVLRQLVLDPLLPEPIAPAAERRALVEAMTEYDRLGRSAWAAFLAGHGVPHRRTPLDLRVDPGIRVSGEAA